MLLSNLLTMPVVDPDGQRIGWVVDVRLAARRGDDYTQPTQVWGLVVSPHTHASYLGYERTGVNAPWGLAHLLRWRHRGSFLAAWGDIARIDKDCAHLRSGYRRYSPALD